MPKFVQTFQQVFLLLNPEVNFLYKTIIVPCPQMWNDPLVRTHWGNSHWALDQAKILQKFWESCWKNWACLPLWRLCSDVHICLVSTAVLLYFNYTSITWNDLNFLIRFYNVSIVTLTLYYYQLSADELQTTPDISRVYQFNFSFFY